MNAKVRDVMTRDVVSVHCHAPFKDIARTLFDREISAVPVLDDTCHVIGIVCAADLVEQLARPQRAPRAVSAGELMTSPVVSVTPDTAAAAAARLMYRNAVKHLPVVGDSGRLIGIVSEKDLLSVFLRPDAEIQEEIVRRVIRRGPGPDPRTVTVSVRDGIATLGGSVPDEQWAGEALRRVRAVDGVIGVVNRVRAGAPR